MSGALHALAVVSERADREVVGKPWKWKRNLGFERVNVIVAGEGVVEGKRERVPRCSNRADAVPLLQSAAGILFPEDLTQDS